MSVLGVAAAQVSGLGVSKKKVLGRCLENAIRRADVTIKNDEIVFRIIKKQNCLHISNTHVLRYTQAQTKRATAFMQ